MFILCLVEMEPNRQKHSNNFEREAKYGPNHTWLVKRIVGNPFFNELFKKRIKRYKKDVAWTSCDSLHAWL